jgi:competence protein ComEA
MQIRKFIFRFIAAAGLIAVPVFSASGQAGNSSAPAGATEASSLPDGPGKQIIQKSCLVCHGVSNITGQHASESDWSNTVSDMIGKGADISDDDANTLVKYLAAHFGPSSAPKPDAAAQPQAGSAAAQPEAKQDASSDAVNVNKATAAELESKLGLTDPEATALIHYREQKGDFKTMQDLSAVPGLDADKIKNQQSKITF